MKRIYKFEFNQNQINWLFNTNEFLSLINEIESISVNKKDKQYLFFRFFKKYFYFKHYFSDLWKEINQQNKLNKQFIKNQKYNSAHFIKDFLSNTKKDKSFFYLEFLYFDKQGELLFELKKNLICYLTKKEFDKISFYIDANKKEIEMPFIEYPEYSSNYDNAVDLFNLAQKNATHISYLATFKLKEKPNNNEYIFNANTPLTLGQDYLSQLNNELKENQYNLRFLFNLTSDHIHYWEITSESIFNSILIKYNNSYYRCINPIFLKNDEIIARVNEWQKNVIFYLSDNEIKENKQILSVY